MAILSKYKQLFCFSFLAAAMLLGANPGNSHASSFDLDRLHLSVTASYGVRFFNFGFIKGKQPELRSVNVSVVGHYGMWFAVVSADDSVSAATVNELGIQGTATREDLGFTIGRAILRYSEPEDPRWTLSPYWYVGYSDGETSLAYEDGLGISFTEAGGNAGLGFSLFDELSLTTINLSVGYAYLFDSVLMFTTDIERTTEGNTNGYSFNLSVSGDLAKNFDWRIGYRYNKYVIDFTTGSFQGTAEDELRQFYVGLRYFVF